MSELSRIKDENAGTFAVNPTSLIDDGVMIAYHDRDTALGVSEQLYTARGSQGLGTYDRIRKFGVDPSNYEDLAMLLYRQENVQTANYKVRPIFTTKANPDFLYETGAYGLIQIPLYLQMTNLSMD